MKFWCASFFAIANAEASASYVIGSFGARCPVGAADILSESQCREAATSLGRKYSGSTAGIQDIPQGCLTWADVQAAWNAPSTGGQEASTVARLCQQTSSVEAMIHVNASKQCSTSAYTYCCGVGKACMCAKPKGSSGQCASAPYSYCCGFGTPCDCTKGPTGGGLGCKVIDLACDALFTVAVDSKAACLVDTAEAVATCEAVGLGPEDPLADACAFVLGTIVTTACEAAVAKGVKFGKAECKKAAGCSSQWSASIQRASSLAAVEASVTV